MNIYIEKALLCIQGISFFLVLLGIYRYTLTVRLEETGQKRRYEASSCLMVAVGAIGNLLFVGLHHPLLGVALGVITLTILGMGVISMIQATKMSDEGRNGRK